MCFFALFFCTPVLPIVGHGPADTLRVSASGASHPRAMPVINEVERTGAVVKPRTLGREVPGSSPPVAVRCGLEQVTYPQLLR